MNLSTAQIEVLQLHAGTTKAKPRHRKYDDKGRCIYFRVFQFPTHPTTRALAARGLLDYRGFDGETAGGWFITDAGTKALAEINPVTVVKAA